MSKAGKSKAGKSKAGKSKAGKTPAPASLVHEVEVLIERGERAGHQLPSRPEIRLGDRSVSWPARSGQPARITIDHRLLQRSAADRSWVIAHELGHLLPTTQRPWSVLQRALITGGLAVLAVNVLGFLLVAVPLGWASIPAGPAWSWVAAGVVVSLLMAVAGGMQHQRDIELAADRAAVIVFSQTMSVEHVAWMHRREGFGIASVLGPDMPAILPGTASISLHIELRQRLTHW